MSKERSTNVLTHLKLNNFKIWRSTGQMQLAPLTLVFGTNSSGKSSLIQSLLLLRQTVKSQDPNLDLNFGNPDAGDSVVLGQFADVLCRHGAATEAVKAKQIGIELGWRSGVDAETSGIFSARYDLGPGGSADLAYLRIGRGMRGFTATRGKHGAYKLQAADQRRAVGQSPAFRPHRSFEFSAAAIEQLGASSMAITAAGSSLVEELSKVIYLGPVRRLAQRDYLWSGRPPGAIGDDGANAIDALIASGVARAAARRRGLPPTEGGRLIDEAAHWLSAMRLATDLEVRQLGNSARYELLVINGEQRSNLKDVGVGVSQVLPVIVAALFAAPGHTVIVEEPESHLHPMAQTQLAELFIQISAQRNVQFIVESHSEHLLLRLQRRVAEKVVALGQVATYFLQRSNGYATLERLEMTAEGEISNWPVDFFGDDLGEIAARTLAGLPDEPMQPTTQDNGQK